MASAQPLAPLEVRLVDEALAILAEDGLAGLSLRRIAQRAGVSHGAPARHFAGLPDLLAEVAARGFDLLSASVAEGAAAAPPGAGSLTRLRGAGRGYLEAATAHPELFALMFRPQDLDFANPSLARASTEAFEHLVGLVRAAQDAGFAPERDTRVLSGAVWAAVHGMASLWSQGALPNAIPGVSLDDALETTLSLILDDAPRGAI